MTAQPPREQHRRRLRQTLAALSAAGTPTPPATATGTLLVEVDDEGIAVITINRPEAKNAFTFAMSEAFHGAFLTLGDDPKAPATHPLACSRGRGSQGQGQAQS